MGNMGVKVKEEPVGSGIQCIKINYKGYRKHITVGRDKRLANHMAKEIRRKLLLGQWDLEKPKEKTMPTLKQYVDGWNDEDGGHPAWSKKRKKGLKYSTLKGYEDILKKHFLSMWGNVPIDKISYSNIDAYIDKLSEEPAKSKKGKIIRPALKPNTLSNIKSALGAVFKQAIKDGYLTSNPTHDVEIPESKDEPEMEPNPFTWEERDVFEKVLLKKYPRHYALVVTGFRSGLRIGELIGLRVDDLDFFNGVIDVQNNITRSRETTPKSKTSIRKVRMSKQLIQILQQQIKSVQEETLRKKWGDVPKWVFVNEEGSFINYGNFMHRVWNKAMKEAKLINRTPHDMRHTYATMRLSGGHPLHEVAKELGHSSPVITYKLYYKFIPSICISDIDEIDGKSNARIRKPDANLRDEVLSQSLEKMEAATRFELVNNGFAVS